MIEGLKERFVIVRKYYRLNVKDFAESLDMEPTTVSSIESGKREPSKEVLLNLAIKYPINLNWIFTGKGSMFPSPSDNSMEVSGIGEIQNRNGVVNIGNANQVTMTPAGETPKSLPPPPPEEVRQPDQGGRAMTVFEIPLLTKEQVLHFNAAQEIPSPKAHSGEYPDYMLVPMPKRFVEYSTDLRAIVVFNSLMSPLLNPGEVAIFQATGWNGDGVYVYRMKGDLYMNHVKSSGTAYRLTKEFRAEEELPYDERTFEAIGRVRAVVREIP
jgi:transcriptional regulator with XRE-family HTH domain